MQALSFHPDLLKCAIPKQFVSLSISVFFNTILLPHIWILWSVIRIGKKKILKRNASMPSKIWDYYLITSATIQRHTYLANGNNEAKKWNKKTIKRMKVNKNWDFLSLFWRCDKKSVWSIFAKKPFSGIHNTLKIKLWFVEL